MCHTQGRRTIYFRDFKLRSPSQGSVEQYCTLLWRETHLEIENVKTQNFRMTFGNLHVEKMYAVAARSTLGSKKREKPGVLSDF